MSICSPFIFSNYTCILLFYAHISAVQCDHNNIPFIWLLKWLSQNSSSDILWKTEIVIYLIRHYLYIYNKFHLLSKQNKNSVQTIMAMSDLEEDHEGPRVLGIGLGLFILILLWSFSLVGSLLLSRMSSGISTIIILVAGKKPSYPSLISFDTRTKLKLILFVFRVDNSHFDCHSTTSPSVHLEVHRSYG